MEMDMTLWMERFVAEVRRAFGSRVYCIGLQGSRARGEATEDSDIDVVVILDAWRTEDWTIYAEILDSLPERDKVCGFVSGKEELLHWEPSELFGFYYDTEPWYGDLEALKACFDMEDARRAVHMGACSMYHACAHNLLHAKDGAALRELYKSAFFVLRAAYYCRTGDFVRRRADLLPLLNENEHEILAAGMAEADDADLFALRSNQLLAWAGGLIRGWSDAERG